MSEAKFVALDFGATSGRAILGRITDRIELKELTRFPNRMISLMGTVHWDALALFDEIKSGLKKAVSEGHHQLEGVGVDTWGVDFGLIGRNDTLLGNPVSYRDPRTDGVMDALLDRIPRQQIYEKTGTQFMPINSLYQLLQMVQSQSPLLDVAETLLFMPDLFNYFMTGERVSEYTIASTTQMLNATRRVWDEKLFKELNLPLDIMAPIIEPGTVVGPLRADVATECGLSSLDVIASASHDTASAVAAVPAKGDSWAYLSSGTWSLVGVEAQQPIINADSLARNFTNEGGVEKTIRFLRNAMGMWLLEGCKTSWERGGKSFDYAVLIEMAEKSEPFARIIDPDVDAFIHPEDMPTAIAAFCRQTGQSVPESKGEFVRCIFESLALKYRFIIEGINNLRNNDITALHIVGGGSQNQMLNQFTANALGLPVVTGPIEATAIGNILVQAMAKGVIRSISEGRELVARSFPLSRHDPRDSDRWEEAYAKAKRMFIKGLDLE